MVSESLTVTFNQLTG